jgi:ketosteroid isomerase-like protein
MANKDKAVNVLVKYYEAICAGAVSGISEYFDDTVTLISLTGSNAVSGSANIEGAFETLLDTWKNLGVS